MKVLYFGCIREVGHYLYDTKWTRSLDFSVVPWDEIDGKLCPQETTDQGASELHQKEGWTALAFWDYSIDKRPGSNSVFFAEGLHTFAEMCQISREHFPQVYERIDFIIKR